MGAVAVSNIINASLIASKGTSPDPLVAAKTREAELEAEKASRDAERAEQAADVAVLQDAARGKRLALAAKREAASERLARAANIVVPLGGISGGALLGPRPATLGAKSGTLGSGSRLG